MMKMLLNRVMPAIALGLFALALSACGEDSATQNVSQVDSAMEDVADVSLLPPCDEDNEGIVVLVKSDMLTRVCIDGSWQTLVDGAEVRYSCTTHDLADGSGVKIVCGGDSVGVVYSGSDGDAGLNGNDCKVKQGKDSSQFVITCGDMSTTINLVYSSSSGKESSSSEASSSSVSSSVEVSSSSDPEDDDSEPISLDTLSGFSQKGPFVKGSIVNLYELQSGKTLRQTNGNFVGTIKTDDGFFMLSARNLKSQYVLLQATGYYRNEVSGGSTNTKLTLLAYSNILFRRSINVNLLTHLEYDHLSYLVTHDRVRFDEAKSRAQREILTAFHIDTAGVECSEDLNVVGSGKGDAALLAISILLQGDRDIAHLTELLSEMSKDLEIDGEWSNEKTRKEVAEWAMMAEKSGRYADFRKNVQSWGIGESVPDFEPILHNFWTQELAGKDLCEDNPDGKVFGITYTYDDSPKTVHVYCDNGLVKSPSYWERLAGSVCSAEKENQTATYHYPRANYDLKLLCKNGNWSVSERVLADSARVGTITDARDGQVYKTAYVGKYNWMAENLRYRYLAPTYSMDSSSFCPNNDLELCEKYGREYFFSAAIDSTALANDAENPRICGYGEYCEFSGFVRGICPEGWHVPSLAELESLLEVDDLPYSLMSVEETRSPEATDLFGFSAWWLEGDYQLAIRSSTMAWSTGVYYLGIMADPMHQRTFVDTAGVYDGSLSGESTESISPIRCVEDYEE
jgi:uncharacterized protein (TIGR02145 family)